MHSLFRRAKAPPAAAYPPAPMPMLSFPGKKALRFAVVDTTAAEKDPGLAVLMLARTHVVDASENARASAAALRAYLRAIHAAKTNAAAPDHQHKLCFAWRDAGDESDKKKAKASSSSSSATQGHSHTSLATEWAVALFAMAAELARVAAADDRRDADGIRRACGALCDAAGALRAARAGAPDVVGDQMCHMTDACLAAFERLMLAQALECYFELAVAGGKPPALCSKIARQVSLDYHEVFVKLGILQQHQQPIDKSWAPHAQGKAAYFDAEASLQLARALREQGPGYVGEAVARLRHAASVLDAATGKTGPLPKKSSSSSCTVAAALAPVRDAAARLRKEVEAELAAAENDNCQVYYERVPAADTLREMPALPESLVRPTVVEKLLKEPDGELGVANGGGAPAIRH
ncbi:hypothetical protein HU200_049621 [Digitaria exilis]|uniref:BRO1 domain-containing protein n=1 Tax=Digitaria exilis TaxID=1010633 RepID=A0A835EB36_9POAL|nr:hypothetical protein HU200_049621 [Digitaria exilis]CAB3499269.1 unnamed protein product [Digitaria exilis]